MTPLAANSTRATLSNNLLCTFYGTKYVTKDLEGYSVKTHRSKVPKVAPRANVSFLHTPMLAMYQKP